MSKSKGLSLTLVTRNTFPVTIVNTRIDNRLVTEVRLRKSIGDWNVTLSARDLFRSNKDRYNIELDELRMNLENKRYKKLCSCLICRKIRVTGQRSILPAHIGYPDKEDKE